MKIKDFLKSIFYIKMEDAIYRSCEKHLAICIFGLKIKMKVRKTKKHDAQKIEHCVALIEPGGLGDYIFVRQYLKYFRKSKYKDCYLVYFAKKEYAKFVKIYDSSLFDEIIIYNENSYDFAKDFKSKIKKYQFDTVINLAGLVEYRKFDNGRKIQKKLIKELKAKEKIADVILPNNVEKVKNKNLNKYTKVFYTKQGNFELERRRLFFEQVLEIDIPKETLCIEPIFEFQGEYIAISLMAMSEERNYNKEKWVEILNYLIKNTSQNTKLLFIGGNVDYEPTQNIIKDLCDNTKCVNICGLTDAAMIPVILKNSKFLLSPETGTVHIAEAVGCKAICLCGGDHYGRFVPHINYVSYVFPNDFQKMIDENNTEKLKEFYLLKKVYKVDEIEVNEVIKKFDSYLKEVVNL